MPFFNNAAIVALKNVFSSLAYFLICVCVILRNPAKVQLRRSKHRTKNVVSCIVGKFRSQVLCSSSVAPRGVFHTHMRTRT